MRLATGAGAWAVILAGGEGRRLRSLTRLIAGDERPKQFCTMLDGETLLESTRRRAGLLIPPERTAIVLTRAHERYYGPLLRDVNPGHLVIQPTDRGTAPAILYSMLRVAGASPSATVVLLPSDHYVSDDAAFMSHVATAIAVTERRRDLVVLLGIPPASAEREYGWIQPGEELAMGTLHRVRRFWEKPDAAVAQALLEGGCLWNSFVIVGQVSALLSLILGALPELSAQFQSLRVHLGSRHEHVVVNDIYARIRSVNFSENVLAGGAANLAVLPVTGVEWSDWGRPWRVLETLKSLGVTPNWSTRLEPGIA